MGEVGDVAVPHHGRHALDGVHGSEQGPRASRSAGVPFELRQVLVAGPEVFPALTEERVRRTGLSMELAEHALDGLEYP